MDLRWLLPCGRVPRIWEREAGSGPEMAIALWKSPTDLGAGSGPEMAIALWKSPADLGERSR